jgi:lactoylglutathione lyase
MLLPAGEISRSGAVPRLSLTPRIPAWEAIDKLQPSQEIEQHNRSQVRQVALRRATCGGNLHNQENLAMRLLHTMIRVNNLDESLKFYCDALGMKLMRKHDYPNGEFTLAFVGYGDERESTVIELTHNWGKSSYEQGDAFGHLAIGTEDIYRACGELKQKGVKVVREPGPMKFGGPEIAFIEDPNGYKIELIQNANRA